MKMKTSNYFLIQNCFLYKLIFFLIFCFIKLKLLLLLVVQRQMTIRIVKRLMAIHRTSPCKLHHITAVLLPADRGINTNKCQRTIQLWVFTDEYMIIAIEMCFFLSLFGIFVWFSQMNYLKNFSIFNSLFFFAVRKISFKNI